MNETVPHRPWWKKERWAAALILWLLAVYPLGHAPAYALVSRTGDPRAAAMFSVVYQPMETLWYDGPEPVSRAIYWHVDLWMPEGWNEWTCCLCTEITDAEAQDLGIEIAPPQE